VVGGLAQDLGYFVLVLEVGVEPGAGDPAGVGDVVDPGPGVAAFQEQPTRGLEDGVAGAHRALTEKLLLLGCCRLLCVLVQRQRLLLDLTGHRPRRVAVGATWSKPYLTLTSYPNRTLTCTDFMRRRRQGNKFV